MDTSSDPLAKYYTAPKPKDAVDATDPLAKYMGGAKATVSGGDNPATPVVPTPTPTSITQPDTQQQNLDALKKQILEAPDNPVDRLAKHFGTAAIETVTGLANTVSNVADRFAATGGVGVNNAGGQILAEIIPHVTPYITSVTGSIDHYLKNNVVDRSARSSGEELINKAAGAVGSLGGMAYAGGPIGKGISGATSALVDAAPSIIRNRALAAIVAVGDGVAAKVTQVVGNPTVGAVAGQMVKQLPNEAIQGLGFVAATDPEALGHTDSLKGLAAFTLFGNLVSSTLHIKGLAKALESAHTPEQIDAIANQLDDVKVNSPPPPARDPNVLPTAREAALQRAYERTENAKTDITQQILDRRARFEEFRGRLTSANEEASNVIEKAAASAPQADPTKIEIAPALTPREPAPALELPDKSKVATFGLDAGVTSDKLTARQKVQHLLNIGFGEQNDYRKLSADKIEELWNYLYPRDTGSKTVNRPMILTADGLEAAQASRFPYDAAERELVDQYNNVLKSAGAEGVKNQSPEELEKLMHDMTNMLSALDNAPQSHTEPTLRNVELPTGSPNVAGSDIAIGSPHSPLLEFGSGNTKNIPTGRIEIARGYSPKKVDPVLAQQMNARQNIVNQIEHPEVVDIEAPGTYLRGLKDITHGVEKVLNKIQSRLQDRTAILKNFEDIAPTSWGDGQSPRELAQLAAGNSQRAHTWTHGTGPMIPKLDNPVEYEPFVGKSGTPAVSIKEIMSPFTQAEFPDLRAIAVARHVLDKGIQEPTGVAAKLKNADGAIETGVSKQDAEIAWANATDKQKLAVSQLNDYNDALLEYGLRRGFVKPENADKWRELYSAFVPLERVFQNDTRPGLFRKIVGSKRMIADPITTMIKRTQNGINAIEKNYMWNELAGRARENPQLFEGVMDQIKSDPNIDLLLQQKADDLVSLAENQGVTLTSGQAMEMVNALDTRPIDKTGDKLVIFNGGIPETWRVDPELKLLQSSMGTQEYHWVTNLFNKLESPLRTGVSVGLDISGIGPLMDQWDATIQSQYGYRFGVDWFKGMGELIKKGDLYKERMAAGGGLGGRFSSLESNYSRFALNSIGQKTALEKLGAAVNPLNAMDALKIIMTPISDATRMGAYMRARSSGANAAISALESRRVIGGDWGQIGTTMAGLNRATAFLNVGIQAHKTLVSSFINNPKRASLMALASVTLPELYFWAAAHGDDELNDLRRGAGGWNSWFVRLPGVDAPVRIPKPRLVGQVFGTALGTALDKLIDDDPIAGKNLADALKQHASLNMIPTSAATAMSVWANKDNLAGRPIIPQGLQNVEGYLQSTDNTRPLSKVIAQRMYEKTGGGINISPITLDYITNQYLGNLGKVAYSGVGASVSTSNDGPVAKVSDTPIYGRWFAKYPTSSVGPLREFYDFYDNVGTKFATADKLQKSNRIPELMGYIDKNANAIGVAPMVAETKQQIEGLYKQIHEVNSVPNAQMSREEKRRITDHILHQAVDAARIVNKSIHGTRKDLGL